MKLVTINGSLRKESSNGALLRAVAGVVPPDVEVQPYELLGHLPHFNPDLDGEGLEVPDVVQETRALFIASSALVISYPEYAHGVPGALKNLLDWLVSTGELVDKPVSLLNASPVGGAYAQASLMETLRTMNWRVILEASLVQPFVSRKIVGELNDPDALRQLESAMRALIAAL